MTPFNCCRLARLFMLLNRFWCFQMQCNTDTNQPVECEFDVGITSKNAILSFSSGFYTVVKMILEREKGHTEKNHWNGFQFSEYFFRHDLFIDRFLSMLDDFNDVMARLIGLRSLTHSMNVFIWYFVCVCVFRLIFREMQSITRLDPSFSSPRINLFECKMADHKYST